MIENSADLSDAFLEAMVLMCRRLECRAVDMAGCWISESNMMPMAHNPGGNASGLFQVMPATLSWLGYSGKWDDFVKLSAEQQLPWAEKFYSHQKGRLVSPGACYLATFLPALMPHANEPMFILCASNGPFQAAYAGNRGAFDPSGKGYITVQDLTDRIDRVLGSSSRAQDIMRRIKLVEATMDTDEVPIVPEDDMPVFGLADPTET